MWIEWSNCQYWHSKTGQVLAYEDDFSSQYGKGPHVVLYDGGHTVLYEPFLDEEDEESCPFEFLTKFIDQCDVTGE